ncbi:hypothetical protein FE257_004606 [Aspergillus nanangensis]|uniref:Uncharacterized protein n=1 Tax=Aspergillus nanangensis TaxID=2582783 RepID=A0AAD4CYQ4_ASPNN|nr:hypothetical protein FE257_004606 [Aspergillus nanangensis]
MTLGLLNKLNLRYTKLLEDRSLFELLPTGGQCNLDTREALFRIHIVWPLIKLLPEFAVNNIKLAFHCQYRRVIALHCCTARRHCPLLLTLWYLSSDIESLTECKRRQDGCPIF